MSIRRGECRGICRHHLDPIRRAETADEPAEVVGTSGATIDEHEAQIGAGAGDHQTGHAAPAAEVDDGATGAGQGADEGAGVGDDLVDRAPTEHPEALRLGERLGQRPVRHPTADQPGATITRR